MMARKTENVWIIVPVSNTGDDPEARQSASQTMLKAATNGATRIETIVAQAKK